MVDKRKEFKEKKRDRDIEREREKNKSATEFQDLYGQVSN